MKKKIKSSMLLSCIFLITACGTVGNDLPAKSTTSTEEVKDPVIEERKIIAELKKTTDDLSKRDVKVTELVESEDYKSGVLGEPSQALTEDMAVQSIEFSAVIEALEKVYGNLNNFDQSGVIFLENQMQDAVKSGVWIGVKERDDQVEAFIRELQLQVDQGEILAEAVHIYHSPHSQIELNTRQDEVAKVLQPLTPEYGSSSVSMNIVTGDIEIGHDFLGEEKQAELRKQFSTHSIQFEQLGRMAVKPGASIIEYANELYTTKSPESGDYILKENQEQFLAGNIYFDYPGDIERLKVGQRVEVEAAGGIALSDPGQGTAKYVKVLPDYKPESAKFSASEVVQKAVKQAFQKSDRIPHFESIIYDDKTKTWVLSILQNEESYKVSIEE